MSARRLLYFTDSYPYGLGEEWKRRELEVFRTRFETIEVVPFHYGGNRHPKPPIPGIRYHAPLWPEPIVDRRRRMLARVLMHPRRDLLLRELRTQGVGLSRRRFARWLGASDLTLRLSALPALAAHLARTPADTVLYFFWARGSSQVLPLLDTSRFHRVALRLHGYDLYDESEAGLPYQGLQLARATDVLPCSEFGATYLRRKFPWVAPKLHTAILGTESCGRSRSSADGIVRLVTCALVRPVKRMHLVVAALRHVGLDVEWTHLGDGPDLPALQRLAARELSGGRVRVRFVGRLEPADVPRFYAEHPVDVFLNVSASEGLPVSIMEAFAGGVPAIATSVGGVPELVDETTGHLLPADCSPLTIARAIERIATEADGPRRARRDAAYARFQARFDATRNAATLADRLVR